MELSSTVFEITFSDDRLFSFDFVVSTNAQGGKTNFIRDSAQSRGHQRGETGLTTPDTLTVVVQDDVAETINRLNQAFKDNESVGVNLFDGKGEKYIGTDGTITTAPYAKSTDESESSGQITLVFAFSKSNFDHIKDAV